jgi:hypothetical protein
MTARDRILLLVVGGVALLGGFWFLALAPKRHDAKALDAQIVTAQQRLRTAQAAAADAAGAKHRYESDYATVARLGKAVPSDDETATLLYQLQSAARGSKVDMRTFELGTAASSSPNSAPAGSSATATGASAATSAAATQAAAATLPPGASVGPAGFPTMPFAFTFDGTFADMEHLLETVQRFVRVNGSTVNVNGRLLTIDGISLIPQNTTHVTATIAATAFVLPPSASTSSSTGTAPSDQTASASSTSNTTSAIGVAP